MAEMTRSSEAFRSLAASIEKTFTGGDSQVSRLLAGASDLVSRISTLLDENRQRVGELLAQSAGLARDARGLVGDARTVVNDNRAELHAAIAGMRTLAETLNRRADELAAEATKTAEELRSTVRGGREDFQGLLVSMRAAAGSAEKAADTLTKILAKVDEGKGTIGRLVNDEKTVDQVDAALKDIDGIAAKINSGQGSLGRLVTDDTLVKKLESTADSAQRMLGVNDRMRFFLGYRGEYLERPTAFKSYVTVKLQPRPDKYYLLEVVDDPEGKTTITKTKTTIQQPDGTFVINETEEETRDDKLLFSLLFAKSLGPLTFRGGLMESQGGVGLDWRPAGERLKLSAEGWHFGREGGPHLKVTGQVGVYKDFFLNAGIDDVYDETRRSVFVGGGILFSDEDLREMLGLARFAQ
jgi:phospholipid/cholesterol/gamma-HCH transport system substrate-binding protein